MVAISSGVRTADITKRQELGLLLSWFLMSAVLTPVCAKDFGVHGTISEIAEEDPIVLIQKKLKTLDENGELETHKQGLQKKAKTSVERPKPVAGLSRGTKGRIFYFDPSYIVPQDLKDHLGRVFAKKGSRINPLETISWNQTLLFFDGDDVEQKVWVEAQLRAAPIKLILIKGEPLVLSEEWKQPVFFDQGGILTKKLGIKHVPARVTQDGLRLKIEEVKVEEDQ